MDNYRFNRLTDTISIYFQTSTNSIIQITLEPHGTWSITQDSWHFVGYTLHRDGLPSTIHTHQGVINVHSYIISTINSMVTTSQAAVSPNASWSQILTALSLLYQNQATTQGVTATNPIFAPQPPASSLPIIPYDAAAPLPVPPAVTPEAGPAGPTPLGESLASIFAPTPQNAAIVSAINHLAGAINNLATAISANPGSAPAVQAALTQSTTTILPSSSNSSAVVPSEPAPDMSCSTMGCLVESCIIG